VLVVLASQSGGGLGPADWRGAELESCEQFIRTVEGTLQELARELELHNHQARVGFEGVH
jgi:hypothetical protein